MDFDCKDLPNIIENPRVLDKDSASPTDVILATLRSGEPVAIKAFLDTSTLPPKILNSVDDKHQDVLGVKYEMRVYEEIVTRIINGRYSPNFVPYIGKFNCTMGEVVKFFGPTLKKGIEREYKYELKKIPADNVANLGFRMLVTGAPGNGAPITSLASAWTDLDTLSQLNVMFQIVYSVAVMQEFRLIHNDLHAGNVLLTILPQPVVLYYVYKRKIFKVVTKFVPYLFDWDLGYSELLGKNQKITSLYCREENVCNRFSSKMDLYILFCALEFKGFIPGTYATPENRISNLMENQVKIRLPSADFVTEFKRTHSPFFKPDIYKMSRGQLIRAFGEEWTTINLGNVVSAMFTLQRDTMTLYTEGRCRPHSFSSSMPSPKEFLEGKYFDSLQVRSLEGANPSVVYRFPSRQTETKESLSSVDKSPVYISPYMVSTREQIAGRGRFPPLGVLQATATFRQLKQSERSVVLPESKNLIFTRARKSIYEWLHELETRFYPTNPQIYFWAVKLSDLYMYTHPVHIKQYQKVVASAFILVSKWISKSPIPVWKISSMMDNAYSIDEIKAQIIDMQKYFNGRLIPTDLQFYMIYASYMDPERRPISSDVAEFLREQSYKITYPSQLPSDMALLAIQKLAPNSINDRIQRLSRQTY